jgi:hemerythrin-like domain-containing protein
MDTAVSWHVEHTHFERLLAYLEGQLGVLRDGDLPNYDLMCDVTTYFSQFGNRYHHAREGVAFGYIAQSNPAMSSTISRLVQEHADIAAKGEELDALLARPVKGNAIARASIEDVLAAFLTAYRNHIAAEEQDILPYAAESLSAMEWGLVARALPPGPDFFRKYDASRHNSPTFGSEAEARYRAVCEMIRTGRSARPRAHRVRRAEGHQENRAGDSEKVAGFLAVPRAQILPRGVANARRLLVKQTIGLLALVLAYLQYYYFDVQLQILSLPSVFPGPLQ